MSASSYQPLACYGEHTIENIPQDFSSDFYNVALDRIDPIKVNCSEKSLWLIAYNHPIRKVLSKWTNTRLFKTFILVVILANAVTLALRDPGLQDNERLQRALDITDILFLCIFAVEMVAKILTHGFVLHRNSYLRHTWNVLDAIVVLSGFPTIFLSNSSGVSAIRVIRVFRPLRAFAYVKSLRHILNRLVQSIPKMVQVLGLFCFTVVILDVIGLHLFMGVLNTRCFADISATSVNVSDPSLTVSVVGNTTYVMIMNDTQPCGFKYNTGRICGVSSNGVNLPQACLSIPDSMLQVPVNTYNYNNAVYCFLLIFKIITRDNWNDDLNRLAQGVGIGGAFAYTFVCTLFAGYFCVNLFIAVFETAFSKREDDDAEFSSIRGRVTFTTVLGARTVMHPALFATTWRGQLPDDGTDVHSSHRRRTQQLNGTPSSSFHFTLDNLAEAPASPPDFVDDATTTSGSPHEPTSATTGTAATAAAGRHAASQKTSTSVLQNFVHWATKQLRRTGSRRVAALCDSGGYQLFLILLVTANSIILAMDRTDLQPTMVLLVRWGSFAFSIAFIVDAVLKIIGYGPSYFRSPMNLADFVLCIISIPDIVALTNSAWTSLRAFRLVRLLRVAHSWKRLQHTLACLVRAVRSVASLSLVGFIVIYIYAILGFQLFGVDVEGQRMSFATIFDSLVSVFICVTGENQDDMAASLVNQFNLASVLFFITLTVFGNFILTNLFIAIILENFAPSTQTRSGQQQSSDKDEDESENDDGHSSPLHQRLPPPTEYRNQMLQRRRILLEPDEVGDAKQMISLTEDEDNKQSSSDVMQVGYHAVVEASGSAQPGGAANVGHLFSGAGTKWNEAAHDIQTALGLQGCHAFLSQFAADERIERSALVGDATYLTRAAEQQLSDLPNLSSEQQTSPSQAFHDVVRRVMQATRSRKQSSMTARKSDSPSHRLEDFSKKFHKFDTIAERLSHMSKWAGLKQSAFCCAIPPTNVLRTFIGSVLKSRGCQWSLVIITLASSIFLALDNDTIDLGNVIVVSDIVFCALFLFEAAVKMFALGLFRHRGAYFRSVWNFIDLLVALFSLLALFYPDLKLFRAFRVLRLLNLSFTLRVIVSSLMGAVPGISAVAVFVALMFLVYAVFGVGLFKGLLYECNDSNFGMSSDCVGTFDVPQQEAFGMVNVTVARDWVPSITGCTYDNVEGALYCLFRLANQDNWFSQMYAAVDHVWKAHTTGRNANPVASLYFISFMIFGQFFAVNLFIGVLVDQFVEQRRRGEGHALLTPSQHQWVLMQKVLFRAEVRGIPERPQGWRGNVHAFIMHRFVDHVMYLLIVANSVILGSYFSEMTNDLRNSFDVVNDVLIALFSLELLLKCIGLGPAAFFASSWNRLDVLAVLVSWVGVILQTQDPIFRVFCATRLLMLLRKMNKLQTLFMTLYHAIPEMLNVGLVLLVAYFIFAVIGVQLFSGIPRGPVLNDNINFSHVGYAFVTLYVLMTQEGWADITDALSEHSKAAVPFVIVFMISVSWILINLLVTVVVDIFGEAEETEQQEASMRVIDAFRAMWCQYDPQGKKVLPCKTVLHILPTLPSSVWDRSAVSASGNQHLSPTLCILKQLQRYHIPVDAHKQVRYEDCCSSLAMRLFSLTVSEAIHVSQSTVHGVSWKPDHYSIHHEFAATLISRCYRTYRASFRERVLEAQLRMIQNQHAIVVRAELQPLRRAYQDAVRLLRWMAVRFPAEEHEDGERSETIHVNRKSDTPQSTRMELQPDEDWSAEDIQVVFPEPHFDDVAVPPFDTQPRAEKIMTGTPPPPSVGEQPSDCQKKAHRPKWNMTILDGDAPS